MRLHPHLAAIGLWPLMPAMLQRPAPLPPMPDPLPRWEDDGGAVAPDDGLPFTNYTRMSRQVRRRLLRKGW